MKVTTMISAVLLAGVASTASADRMDSHLTDVESNAVYSAARDDNYSLDDGRMNAQLLTDELALPEAFSDPELLAELGLDDLDSFDHPSFEGLLSDKN